MKMKCHNCNKNAMYAIGDEGKEIPLCLDCYIKYENMQLLKQADYQREINYLKAEIESSVGLTGLFPKYPESTPRYIIHQGGITLNNIHINNSEIGVLNTGNIENVDSTVTVLKGFGNSQLATAITELTEAIIKSNEISNNQKNQIIELLSSISTEAVAPKEKRKNAVIKVLFAELSGILSGISTVADVWEKSKDIIGQIFQ